MSKYSVRRYFSNGDNKVLYTGLTLQDAQEHCRGPETSSRTCQQKSLKDLTKAKGDWLDGYGEDRND